MAVKLEKWLEAKKKYRLFDKQIQMARELGLNPDKFEKLNNHKQEPWKLPLPQFIENTYYKHFKREEPETVKPITEIIAEKKKQQEKKKKERKKELADKKQNEAGLRNQSNK